MFGKKVEIDRALYEALGREALRRGYADADEFIRHVLELIADKHPGAADESIRERLKGLGYLE